MGLAKKGLQLRVQFIHLPGDNRRGNAWAFDIDHTRPIGLKHLFVRGNSRLDERTAEELRQSVSRFKIG